MGYCYFSIINSKKKPTIGILNIGTENNKGLEFLQEAADLISKSFAINNLSLGESSTTLLPFIDILLIYNSGIAFGIFDNSGMLASNILLLVTLIILCYLIWMIIYEPQKNKKYS